ncbi:uncharacterized protein LOC129729934 isoform X2 [Wyeomyia smithii]|uniref:uncharacterized protein LOC129729934 isoform X2 n=1 Tax=Wyeomyia smithii TaxID=174621 RepID=UPI002467BA67|nr:uncharacterized protein LOC129729934 isoform X2 [Wyeomyia smithii]
MECKLISRYSPLLVLFLASLVNAQTGRKRELNNLYQVIYYGDSQVEVGKPFTISCIISITDPVEWHKDGEPIRKHSNIRHGKDEHSYIESEMGIAGNRDKIEATISVQRALPKHQGRYQCNSLYKNYHMLYVHRNGSLGGGSIAIGTNHDKTAAVLDKLDEPVVGPLLLTTIKPTLITSIAEPHHPSLSTAGSLVPLDVHTIGLESDHSPHHHRQSSQSHHHHLAAGDKFTKPNDKPKTQHTFNGNQNQPEDTKIRSNARDEDESPPSGNQLEKGGKGDGYSETARAGKDRTDVMIVNKYNEKNGVTIPVEDVDVASGEFSIPLEEKGEKSDATLKHVHVQVALPDDDRDDNDDNDDYGTSIVIESKDVSVEDGIDKLILNKSEINGIIRVDIEEEPPRRHHTGLVQPPRKLDRIQDEKMMIVDSVLPTGISSSSSSGSSNFETTSSTATTALMLMPTISVTIPASSTTIGGSTTKHGDSAHAGHGNEGHHHHHHHEHEQEHRQHAASAEILQPNYDDPSSISKFFDIGKAITLGCNVTKEGYDLSWSKDGKNVSDVVSLKDRYRILNEERKFIISRSLESDAGTYTCSVLALNASRTFNVVANVFVKFESTEIGKTNMVEGEQLSLHCIAFGTNPKISWIIGNKTYTTGTDHIHLDEDDKGVENARLTIEAVAMSDYMDYTCEARNNATEFTGRLAHATITVRIRGKYAALYVFLGIIAEVVVLCAIILICERRRNKTEVEESDTDQSPDQRRRKSSRNYN